MATISFLLPGDKQAQFERFKRTAFLLNIAQGEALAEALEDYNIKHSIMEPEAPQHDKPKNCVDLLLETEPNELRKQIAAIKTEAEFSRAKGLGWTIMEEADKGSLELFYRLRGLHRIKTTIPSNEFQDINESQFIMPVLQGDEGEE